MCDIFLRIVQYSITYTLYIENTGGGETENSDFRNSTLFKNFSARSLTLHKCTCYTEDGNGNPIYLLYLGIPRQCRKNPCAIVIEIETIQF